MFLLKDVNKYYNMYKCNINFETKYAIIKETKETIDIEDYDEKIQVVCKNNHELVAAKGNSRRHYFRHKYNNDMDGNPMTQWHSKWQSNFLNHNTEIVFCNKVGQLKERRADVVVPEFKRIIEIQHSKISSGEVNERNNDYKLHEHDVCWIIDAQNSISIIKLDERIVLEFTSNSWLYESFLQCEYVYYDIDGFIYKLSPKNICSNQIDVGKPKIKSEFIDDIKNKKDFWNIDDIPQAYIYVKQKGAGSGKTYGMIQLLNNDPEISNFKWILFLTKQHSAVNVMYKEFIEQYTQNVLYNIILYEEPIMLNGKYDENQYLSNKKYILKYKHKITNVDTYVIFATIDSFGYSVGKDDTKYPDMFDSIFNSIKEGYSKIQRIGSVKYAGLNPYVNKESIIMIDETQDLSLLYGEAFLKTVKLTHTNLCVVGDRLQSLTQNENALTFLHNANMTLIKTIREEQTNIVRRFSDPILLEFVNKLIPFNKYGLPLMTPHKKIEPTNNALTIFSAKTVYANQNIDTVVKHVNQIMKYIKIEVDNNKCLPEDFLIVTPFTSKNPLVEALQLAINEFWINTMKYNKDYIENVKNKDEYWKDKNINNFIRYAVFHKCQVGGSINLNESIKSTRIVSIHSSKGDGRKVVFVIGVSQSALQVHSQVANNIIYDSLLHVAITRQKERLYFRLEENGDDIHMRIRNSDNNINYSDIDFDYARKNTKLQDINSRLLELSFDTINDHILSKKKLDDLPKESEEKMLIDMGDHNIRYSSMLINVMVYIYNYELRTKQKTKHQFKEIFKTITKERIRKVSNWKEYIKVLVINSKDKYSNDNKLIPILKFEENKNDYYQYYKIIKKTMIRIINELSDIDNKEINYFCPLESVILYYMIESVHNGIYQHISINDIYNIIDIYKNAYDSSVLGHEYCNCNKYFIKVNKNAPEKIKEYLRNHYDRVSHVNNLLERFISVYSNISWLYEHMVYYGDKDKNNFSINKTYNLIGYNDKNVYILNLKSQFNQLNFNEIKVNSIIDTCFLSNIGNDTDNYKKFNNKKIISCILSLDKEEIYEIELTEIVKNNNKLIKNNIRHVLLNKYKNKHEQIFNTFINKYNNITNCKKIRDGCYEPISSKTVGYIEKFWYKLFDSIEDCSNIKEKSEKLIYYKCKENFIKLIDTVLERELDKYLNIDDE